MRNIINLFFIRISSGLRFILFIQMSKIQFVGVVILLVFSVSAIKLSKSMHEGIAYNDTDSYLAALMDQQNQFQQQVLVLDKNLQQTVDSVGNQYDIGKKIDFLEKGILNQESQIYVASTKIIPKLVLKDQCQTLNLTTKQNLIRKSQNTITTLKDVLAKLEKLPQDPRILELKGNCLYQIYYLQTIQTVLKDNCTTTAVLSPTMYQSNLNAVNWIAGNQTVVNLINQYIARSFQYESVTNCPLTQPFYSIQRKCINCFDPTPIFNMKTLQCVNCPEGTAFNPASHACDIKLPNATNPKFVGNTTGEIPTPNQNDVYCPDSHPYFNGTACIQCPQLFNFDQLNCISCSKGNKYNNQTRKCQALPPNATNLQAINQTSQYMNRPNTLVNGPNDILCPADKPYLSTTGCISCSPQLPIFDFKTNLCSRCSNTSYFDFQTRTCVQKKPNATNLTASQNYLGTPPTVDNPVFCSATTPFFNTNTSQCIACTSTNPLFDFSTNTCVKCPNNTYFDINTHTCIRLVPNASNLTASNNYLGTPPPIENPVLCPSTQPFFNTTSCVTCNSTFPLFDFESNKCVACDKAISYFNVQTHSCVPYPPNATNFVAGTNYIGTKKQSPTDIKCPNQTPYFNGSACIVCSQTQPYFNLATKTCVACPDKTAYNPTAHDCIPLKPTGSNPVGLQSSIGNLNTTTDVPCPESQPFFANGSCIRCQQPNPIFNADTQTCIACPTGQFDANTRTCLQYNFTNPNVTNTIGTVTQNTTFAVYCPTATPFYNSTSKTCFACPPEADLYDVAKQVCLTCQKGTVFNPSTHVCDKLNANFTNPAGQNKTIGALPTPSQYDILCPETTPFLNANNQCFNCQGFTYYSLQTKTCVQCPPGTNYNVGLRNCSAQYTSNLRRLNWVAQNPYRAIMVNSSAIKSGVLTVCPDPNPYYDGTQCINCTDPSYPYFNVDVARCTGCGPGTVFNQQTHKCQIVPAPAKTHLQAAGTYILSSETPLQAYKDEVNSQNVPECPKQYPYWNGNSCLKCVNPYIYFNIDIKDCVPGCTADQKLNTQTGQCFTQGGSAINNPNLSSLIENVFRHEKLEGHKRHRII